MEAVLVTERQNRLIISQAQTIQAAVGIILGGEEAIEYWQRTVEIMTNGK